MTPATVTPHAATSCPLCSADGGVLIWRGARLRIIRAEDQAGFAALYRVIWNGHVAEFSDLARQDRQHCMDAVTLVEQLLRQQLAPTKINLATLGNMVPHLHWHIVARFDWDSHFPAPIWASPQRERNTAQEQTISTQLTGVDQMLRQRLESLGTC